MRTLDPRAALRGLGRAPSTRERMPRPGERAFDVEALEERPRGGGPRSVWTVPADRWQRGSVRGSVVGRGR